MFTTSNDPWSKEKVVERYNHYRRLKKQEGRTINPRLQGHTLYSKEQMIAAWAFTDKDETATRKILGHKCIEDMRRRFARDLCIDTRKEGKKGTSPLTDAMSSAEVEQLFIDLRGNKDAVGAKLGKRDHSARFRIADYLISLIYNCGVSW